MAFRLTHPDALTADAHRLVDEELGAAIARLSDDGHAADARVHSARKSIKRVRALLRLTREALPLRRFRDHNAALRDAARGLSAARDAAVALATFDALVPAPDPLLRALRGELAARRGDAGAPDPALLRAAAEALTRARPRILDDLGPLSWTVLEAGLRDSYHGGRLAMRTAFAEATGPDDEAFHAWRKRAKDLWYQCQLLRGACPELLGALEDLLATLGDLLGDDHDLAVLQAAAATTTSALPTTAALQARILTRHHELRAAAEHTGRRVYAERPQAFLRRIRAYWRAWQRGPRRD